MTHQPNMSPFAVLSTHPKEDEGHMQLPQYDTVFGRPILLTPLETPL